MKVALFTVDGDKQQKHQNIFKEQFVIEHLFPFIEVYH